MILDVDQLDLDAFPGEEALLLGDEERPVADPDRIAIRSGSAWAAPIRPAVTQMVATRLTM